MNKRRIFPFLIYVVALIALFSWSMGLFSGNGAALSYSQVLELFEAEQVKSFVVEDQTITLNLHTAVNGKVQITTTLADPETFRMEMQELLHAQLKSGVLEGYDFVPEKGFSPSQLIFPLLTVGVILLLLRAITQLNRERGITVVLITHHMNEAENADRVIVMNDGQVAMDGTPRQVFARVAELREMGLAAPHTVELLSALNEEGELLPLDAITVDECADAICRAFGGTVKE